MRLERIKWELKIVSALLVVSFVLYLVHFVFFRNLHHIWLWSLTSLAFLPISVLVVTLLINRLLTAREKALRLNKLNMLIGTFFSNVGIELLCYFSSWDTNAQYLRNHFGTADIWSKGHPREVRRILAQHSYEVAAKAEGLDELKKFLTGKIDFMMRLLENPNLLEQEDFAELLRAVFHLTEELTYRENIACLPDSDIRHLTGDAKAFCDWLSRKGVKRFRLPTEAEWEYACRANTNTRFSFGESEEDALSNYGNYADSSTNSTEPVGLMKPNAFGLYDMHGNVWEWCSDWYDSKYYATSPPVDPTGPSSGKYRVLRGGSWDSKSRYCRSANRSNDKPDEASTTAGFRIVLEF